MTLEEVKAWLEANKTNSDVAAYLKELSAVSPDKVKAFLDTDEGKRLIQPRLDSHFTKGLETWKQNNLETLIDEEVKKRNPEKSPEQLEIEKLKKQIEEAEAARKREALMNKALKLADEKQLPKDVIDFFIGEDEEKTSANLTKLEEAYKKAVQAAVDEKFKAAGRQLPGSGDGDDSAGAQFAKAANQQTEAPKNSIWD